MFDWLITALGGFTKREHVEWDKLLESWRARCLAAETTVELMKEILTRERERSEKLTEKLMGPKIDLSNIKPPDMRPVGQSVSSWPRIRRELERQHAGISREETKETVRSKVGDSVRNNE